MLKKIFYKDKGFRVFKKNISILAQTETSLDENLFNSDQKLIALAEILDNFLKKTSLNTAPPNYENSKILQLDSILDDVTEKPFYKYISKTHLNKYILEGKFRLGTINYYQNTKNKNIQDLEEGFTHLAINYHNRQIFQSFYSGFNYLIFCGSYISPEDQRSDYLKQNFGECVIKIKHPKSFATALAKHLNSKNTYLHSVKYEPIKIIKATTNQLHHEIGEGITSDLFDLIYNNVTLPSIFLKPISYKKEHEMRYAFRMPKDQNRPLDIHNIGLLDYVEIIQK